MSVTASQLRENIYRLLDKVLETGEALEIKRKGKILKLLPVHLGGKLKRLTSRKTMKGNPEKFVHVDWSKYWKPTLK